MLFITRNLTIINENDEREKKSIGGVKMDIKEIIESEARKRAEVWAKNKKITTGRYPTMEEYLQMKYRFFKVLCKKAYNELEDLL